MNNITTIVLFIIVCILIILSCKKNRIALGIENFQQQRVRGSKSTPCPRGTYQDERGQSSCKPCNSGTYQNMTGQSSCKPCPIGTICPNQRTINPYVCPEGKEARGNSCNSCPPGKYKNSGMNRCENCPQGTKCESYGMTQPIQCGRGEYQNQTGQQECKICPEGTYQNQLGATSLNRCRKCTNPLKVCSRGTQIQNGINCPSGYYSKLSTNSNILSGIQCADCPSGYKCINGRKEICPPGKKSNDDGTNCEVCPKNTYQNESGKGNCKPCIGNDYTKGVGKTKCIKGTENVRATPFVCADRDGGYSIERGTKWLNRDWCGGRWGCCDVLGGGIILNVNNKKIKTPKLARLNRYSGGWEGWKQTYNDAIEQNKWTYQDPNTGNTVTELNGLDNYFRGKIQPGEETIINNKLNTFRKMRKCIDNEARKPYIQSILPYLRTNNQGYKNTWKRIGKCCDNNSDLMRNHSYCLEHHVENRNMCPINQECDVPNMTCGSSKNIICTGEKGNRRWRYRT